MRKNNKTQKANYSSSVVLLNHLFLIGDFFLARKEARKILSFAPADENDALVAKAILKKTLPDYQALLAGILCLLFAVIAAFWASR